MLIDFNQVQFAYPNASQKQVIDIEQWRIDKSAHTFLYGPSGSGKSTLLNLLSGVLGGYHGQINVLNQSLKALSSSQRDRFRAKHIGYVFQQFNLIPFLNALENIALARQFNQSKTKNRAAVIKQSKALLSALQINDSDWAKPVNQLSIGQQQRVAIARALINQPELLIADEPTSSLDLANTQNFIQILFDILDECDTTLVLVSHDMTLAQHFKHSQSITDINRSALPCSLSNSANTQSPSL